MGSRFLFKPFLVVLRVFAMRVGLRGSGFRGIYDRTLRFMSDAKEILLEGLSLGLF